MEELELVTLWGQQEHFSCTHSELNELYRAYPGAIIGSYLEDGSLAGRSSVYSGSCNLGGEWATEWDAEGGGGG